MPVSGCGSLPPEAASAHIHGFEDSSDAHAIVMELVEGPTLTELIGHQPRGIPVDDALPIARQIAEALEAAHELGIVHRDLKPANVKVRDDGVVKVLDFGLAKALDSGTSGAQDSMNSPTLTARATQMGTILGTAAYMAPEQARGRSVDRRADIWAFGVVLFEMLTGDRCFKGEDISDTLAAVLRQDVDWAALPAATPARLRRLLERCLDRDVKQRLRDIGEARVEIPKIEAGAPETSVMSSAGVMAAPTSAGTPKFVAIKADTSTPLRASPDDDRPSFVFIVNWVEAFRRTVGR
jgi:serine/threonine-protein kinase